MGRSLAIWFRRKSEFNIWLPGPFNISVEVLMGPNCQKRQFFAGFIIRISQQHELSHGFEFVNANAGQVTNFNFASRGIFNKIPNRIVGCKACIGL